MDCERCQSLFSELLEKTLAPAVENEAASHLAGCAACRRELHGLRQALAALAAAPAAEPPAGLARAILARLPRAGAASSLPPARPGSPHGRWRAAAAAAIIAALSLLALGLGLVREHSWRSRTAALADRLGEASEDLVRREGEAEAARKTAISMRAELAEARRTSEEARRAAEEAERALATGRKDLEARAEELAAKVSGLEGASREQAAEISRLGAELAASREEGTRLAGELAARRDSRREEAPPPVKVATGEEAAPPQRSSVVFIDRGDHLELQVRGGLEQVVPELLAVARDAGDPAMSSLALGALENLLGRPGGEGEAGGAEGAAREAAGDGAWWRRGVEGFANVVGMGAEPEEAPAPPLSRAKERLGALEREWRRRTGG